MSSAACDTHTLTHSHLPAVGAVFEAISLDTRKDCIVWAASVALSHLQGAQFDSLSTADRAYVMSLPFAWTRPSRQLA